MFYCRRAAEMVTGQRRILDIEKTRTHVDFVKFLTFSVKRKLGEENSVFRIHCICCFTFTL